MILRIASEIFGSKLPIIDNFKSKRSKTIFLKKIIQMALQKLQSNSINSVSFGTEAGVFNKLGFETIVCGPGNIEQAHKPNEYIEESQIIKCQKFLKNIVEYLY